MNINKIVFLAWITCSAMFVASCSFDTREVEPAVSCNTDNVTLSSSVQPILNKNCTVCHSGSMPANNLDLTKYSDLMRVAVNGKLVGAIKHSPGYQPMPLFAPKIADCDIAQIEAWVNAGALNN